MHTHIGAETGSTPAQTARSRRLPPLSLAASRHFRLEDFDLDASDTLMLWAALIESAALCSRLARGRLTQNQTLSQMAMLTPPMSKRPLHDLSDYELADLVHRLREEAERMHAESEKGRKHSGGASGDGGL